MLLTWSSAVIGLATETVIGTVLPFSTSGGMSSLILPLRTGASPTTLRIAEVSIAGVAFAWRDVMTGSAPATAAPPARCRTLRRVVCDIWRIGIDVVLVAKRRKIGHDVLDLLRRQDRLAAPIRPDAHKAIQTIIGGHDRGRIEMSGVHQAQPQLGC